MDYDVACCEIKSNENLNNPIVSNLMGDGEVLNLSRRGKG